MAGDKGFQGSPFDRIPWLEKRLATIDDDDAQLSKVVKQHLLQFLEQLCVTCGGNGKVMLFVSVTV